MSTESLIRLESVSKNFFQAASSLEVLKKVDLEVIKGEFLLIMGPSGCGKSTLLNILGLLDRPTDGRYFLKNQLVNYFSDDSLSYLRNNIIGFIFQFFHLLPFLTAAQNVALPLVYRGSEKGDRIHKAEEALKNIGMEEFIHYKPEQLSGGQKQKIAIARALITNPSLLLCDEPTGSLDQSSGDAILTLLKHLKDTSELTIIMVTHNPNYKPLADRVVEIKNGFLYIN